MTKNQIIKRLRNTEETLLLELLNINSEEIVDAFLDKITERLDYLDLQLSEDFSEE